MVADPATTLDPSDAAAGAVARSTSAPAPTTVTTAAPRAFPNAPRLDMRAMSAGAGSTGGSWPPLPARRRCSSALSRASRAHEARDSSNWATSDSSSVSSCPSMSTSKGTGPEWPLGYERAHPSQGVDHGHLTW